MPNVNYHVYVKCPFFRTEKKKSISCEDTFRTFDKIPKKKAWMRIYCDKDWESCPYADSLNDAYERLWKGDSRALEQNMNEALRKELGNMAKKLGRAEKKAVRQQKKIDELRAVNQSFIDKNEDLEKQKKHYYRKWRDAQEKIDAGNENIHAELTRLGGIYEQRMCYLIDEYAPDKIMYEEDVEKWAEDKEFALVHEFIDVNDDRRTGLIWKVVYKSDEDDSGTVQAEPEGQGDKAEE